MFTLGCGKLLRVPYPLGLFLFLLRLLFKVARAVEQIVVWISHNITKIVIYFFSSSALAPVVRTKIAERDIISVPISLDSAPQ